MQGTAVLWTRRTVFCNVGHHVTNIWHGTKLGFNADGPYFASIIGKTVTQITFYAADGVYVLPVNVAL